MSGFHTLTDEQGQMIPVQVLDVSSRRDPFSRLAQDRENFLSLAFKADDVGGLGFRRYDLSISEDEPDQSVKAGVMCDETSIENDLVKVEMAQNGTVTITDKKSNSRTVKTSGIPMIIVLLYIIRVSDILTYQCLLRKDTLDQ
jgi:hypothetical protein